MATELFQHAKLRLYTHLTMPYSPFPCSLVTTLLLSISINWAILGTSYRWNHTVFVLLCWLISLSIMSSRFGLPRCPSSKETACQCRRRKRHKFDSWLGKILWGRKSQPTPVFLPGKFRGQRNLVVVCGVINSQAQLSGWPHTQTHALSFICALARVRNSFYF